MILQISCVLYTFAESSAESGVVGRKSSLRLTCVPKSVTMSFFLSEFCLDSFDLADSRKLPRPGYSAMGQVQNQ